MASTTRPNQQPWVTAFEAAPPPACATLRALSNTVEYGMQCVFAEEDSDPLPNSINTACLPWATSGLPSSLAFYSPATACPTSWTAVATRTAANGAADWIDGETALECCPPGFVGGSGGLCNPESASVSVVRCGEADAEENENAVYTAGQWPASVSARVTALQLRYQASDSGGTASATSGSSSTGTSTSTNVPGSVAGSGGGLSTGAKAAIGTVIPLVFILGALAAFLLWRRRKHRKAAAAMSKDFADGHETKRSYEKVPQESFANSNVGSKGMPAAGVAAAAVAPAAGAVATQTGQHETPEWNAELDATEAERRRHMAVQGSLFPHSAGEPAAAAASPGGASEASELGGMMRVNRKPVAPVELDSTPVVTEMEGSPSQGQPDGER